MSKIVLNNQTAAPDAPAAGKLEIYSKTDDKLYKKNSAGTETEIGGGSGAGDMLKSTYDTNNDGKVNSADAADAAPWSGITGKPASFTPSTHATSHQSGGADAVKLDDLAAPDDNTDLNASTTKHGLLKKLDNNTANFLRGDGAWAAIPDASDTAKGISELATAAETTTGTSATLAVTPDGLAGSVYGKRVVQMILLDNNTVLATNPNVGGVYFVVPEELNGYNLVAAHAAVTTASSSGTPTITVYNVTDSVEMLSTRITIDANEYTSYTAATAPVIDTTKDDVATGDFIKIECTVAGTGAKGLVVILAFQLP